jgi:putative transposase
MNFMHDELQNGRKYRLFNVIDDFNREGLVMKIDYSLAAERVIRALEQAIEWRGKTLGPEYVSQLLAEWVNKNGIKLLFTQPGNPQQNAYVEQYNRTLRYDGLNQYLFSTLNERPNMAIGGNLL